MFFVITLCSGLHKIQHTSNQSSGGGFSSQPQGTSSYQPTDYPPTDYPPTNTSQYPPLPVQPSHAPANTPQYVSPPTQSSYPPANVTSYPMPSAPLYPSKGIQMEGPPPSYESVMASR